jgi:hypothetical protein
MYSYWRQILKFKAARWRREGDCQDLKEYEIDVEELE